MSDIADHQEIEPQAPAIEVEAPEVEVHADPVTEAPDAGAPVEGHAEAEPEAAPEPEPKKRKDWREARLSEEYARRKAAEEERDRKDEEIRQLRAQLNGDDYEAPAAGAPLTAQQIQAEAARLVAQQNLAAAADKVFDDGVKAFPDFTQVRDQLVSAFGDRLQGRPDFIEALIALPNGHEVFHALGSDLNHAAEVIDMTPARMGIELARLSAELATPKSRPVSSAPAPIRPIAGAARGGPDIYDPNLSDDEYYAIREKQRKAAYEARRH